MTQIILLFIVFNFIYILLPGLIIFKVLKIHLKTSSICNTITIAYFLGFALTIIEYFLISRINAFYLFKLVNPALVFFYIIARHKEISLPKKMPKPLTIIASLVIIMLCYYLSYSYTSAHYIGREDSLNLNHDFFNHVGLVASLSRSLPAMDYKFSGLTLHYHYFQDLLFGMFKNITQFPAIDIVMYCTPVLIALVFGIAAYCLFNKKRQPAHSLSSFLIMLTYGGTWLLPLAMIDKTTGMWSWNNYHIFSSINACGFAMASIIAIIVFIKNIKLSTFSLANCIALALLVFVATGIKGPFVIVWLTAFIITLCLKFILEQKVNKANLVYMMIAATSFVISYILIIYNPTHGAESKTTELSLSLSGTLQRTMLASLPITGILKLPLLVLVAFGPLSLFIIIELYRQIKNIIKTKRIRNITDTVLLSMIIIGAGGFILINQSGYSQIYFIFVAVPPLILITRKTLQAQFGIIQKACVVFTVLSCLFGAYLLNVDLKTQAQIAKNTLDDSHSSTIRNGEIEGLRWLRDNTNANSVVLSDRIGVNSNDINCTDDCRFFAYSALAERQLFLEGFSYSTVSSEQISTKQEILKQIYNEANLNLAAENHIDYIIVTKRLKHEVDFSELLTPVFENSDIAIYQT